MKQIPQHFSGLRALVWPTACIGCGAQDVVCCSGCLQQLLDPTGGNHTVNAVRCILPDTVAVPAVHAYENTMRKILVAYKHSGRTQFLPALGQVLVTALIRLLSELPQKRNDAGPLLLIALPSTAQALRQRGFRHLEILLKYAQNQLKRDSRVNVFQRAPNALAVLPGRRSQVGLRADARYLNARLIRVQQSWQPRIQGRDVVLFDDIVTTGASLRAAYEVLTASRANVVGAVALCSVQRIDDTVKINKH